jgi:hypothetical protein
VLQSRLFALARLALVSLVISGATPSTATTLLPSAVGMMHLYPELGGHEIHQDHITVGYQKTTDVNRQIQRTFVEFALGAEPVASAQLVLEIYPSAVGRFELYAADAPADLAITADDFGRSVTLLAAFDPLTDGTPLPDGLLRMAFDVTDTVDAFLGSSLGFQLRIPDDLERTDFAILGGELSGPSGPYGVPRLLLEPIPEPAPAALLALGLLGLGPSARRRVCR